MKFVLMFLMSVLIVTTHQYFHDQPRQVPWWSPYSPHLDLDKQQPFLIYRSKPIIHQTIVSSQNENEQSDVFTDTESRVKGISLNRLSHLNDEQASGRFLLNLFSSSGTYTNPFFKTATFTTLLSVSLTSIVNCIPSNQMSNGAAATTCSRKRRSVDDVLLLQENQFSIAPSETLKLTPTASTSPYEYDSIEQLSSTKNDAIDGVMSANLNSRVKRFLFANKNQFIVSTTVTSFAFVNTTVTVTRNLLNPLPTGKCLDEAAAPAGTAPAVPQCVACLPFGYIVCPASG